MEKTVINEHHAIWNDSLVRYKDNSSLAIVNQGLIGAEREIIRKYKNSLRELSRHSINAGRDKKTNNPSKLINELKESLSEARNKYLALINK